MKYTSEIKIGITGVVTFAVIFWGINYLKGRNILSSTYTLRAMYAQVDGLEPSADVMLKGFKIGTVEEVIFDTGAEVPFTVVMDIEKAYPVRSGSVAEIYSANLLGSKAIKIIPASVGDYLDDGEVIDSDLSGDMISSLLDEVAPLIRSIDSAVLTLDSTAATVNRLLNDPDVKQTIAHLEEVSGSMQDQFSPEGDLAGTLASLREITENISERNSSIASSIQHFEQISEQISNAALDSLIFNLNEVAGNLDGITGEMQQGSGSLGKLIFEDSLYQQIGRLIADLDSLVSDVNANPKKYVSFSLIGK